MSVKSNGSIFRFRLWSQFLKSLQDRKWASRSSQRACSSTKRWWRSGVTETVALGTRGCKAARPLRKTDPHFLTTLNIHLPNDQRVVKTVHTTMTCLHKRLWQLYSSSPQTEKKKKKPLKYPSAEEQIIRPWYSHALEDQPAIRGEEY